jgi:hypothetical protein
MNKLQLAEENHQSQNFIKMQIRLLENTRLSRPNTIQFNGLVKQIHHFYFSTNILKINAFLSNMSTKKGRRTKKGEKARKKEIEKEKEVKDKEEKIGNHFNIISLLL